MAELISCDRDHVVHKVSVFTVYAVVEQVCQTLNQSKGRPSHFIKKPTTYITLWSESFKALVGT